MSFSNYYTQRRSAAALRAARRTIEDINSLAAELKVLDQDQLKAQFNLLRTASEETRQVRGFAIVREASERTLGMRQFEVQLIGGLVLLSGKVAEMATGEGKTLSIAAPAAVLALDGKSVHVVTANDYLAKRDAQLMRPVYEYLGLTVSHVASEQSTAEKQKAYACDIVYGVGHEFGFDYLKDNLAKSLDSRVQRGLHAAIVDEVDSILIDEARVPLIISKPGADLSEGIQLVNNVVRLFEPQVHFNADLKEKSLSITDEGYGLAEQELARVGLISAGGLYASENLHWVRRLHSAAKAYALFRRDRDYVIEGGELVLVDTGSGRKMPGRRFEDGLHEALESKEGLRILPGNLTAATITYQNFFGLYSRLGGLTGTARTDADEFSDIYGMEVVCIPTNKPLARIALDDVIYATKQFKFEAAVDSIKKRHATGQPILVGCATIRDAEVLSKLLGGAGLTHEVLTAKHLEREAAIISKAGCLGAITVATNMAGRGTDIALGGEKPEKSHFTDDVSYFEALREWTLLEQRVMELGGLHVLGTERNGLRRVDNQLAGRSGRQGNPGSVQFIMSLEDELLKVFSTTGALKRLAEDMVRSGSAVSGSKARLIAAKSQQKVENQGFDARKQLMKYDGVLAEQRKVLYALRDQLLLDSSGEFASRAIEASSNALSDEHLAGFFMEPEQAAASLEQAALKEFGVAVPVSEWLQVNEDISEEEIKSRVLAAFKATLELSEIEQSDKTLEILSIIDELWAEHLTVLDEMKQSAGLKGQTGQNPLYQFTKDGFLQFELLLNTLNSSIARQLLNQKLREEARLRDKDLQERNEGTQRVIETLKKRWILRSEQCPCGSGKAYKHCHGELR